LEPVPSCLTGRHDHSLSPDERVKAVRIHAGRILSFAQQRLGQLQRLLEKEEKGRPLTARELLEELEDYSRIVDTIDTVSDDALKRCVDIAEGRVAVTDPKSGFWRGPGRSKIERLKTSIYTALPSKKRSAVFSGFGIALTRSKEQIRSNTTMGIISRLHIGAGQHARACRRRPRSHRR
jgi:hypothetical protein